MLSLRLWNYWIVQTTGSWFKELIKFIWHFTSLINSWSTSAYLGSQEAPSQEIQRNYFWWCFPAWRRNTGMVSQELRIMEWFELERSLKILSPWASGWCHPSPEKGDRGTTEVMALPPSQPSWRKNNFVFCEALVESWHWLSVDRDTQLGLGWIPNKQESMAPEHTMGFL